MPFGILIAAVSARLATVNDRTLALTEAEQDDKFEHALAQMDLPANLLVWSICWLAWHDDPASRPLSPLQGNSVRLAQLIKPEGDGPHPVNMSRPRGWGRKDDAAQLAYLLNR